MRTFLDAKLMAKALRDALAASGQEITHSQALELIAKQFGLPDWNTLAARIATAEADDVPLRIPSGWYITGNTSRKRYRAGVDPAAPNTALIACRYPRESGDEMEEHFGVLMQSVLANDYTGRAIRLSASLRTEDADAATIWLRVDKGRGQTLEFENLLDGPDQRALAGTTDWTDLAISLNVPDEAESIHFGFLLKGYGRVYARGFQLESTSDAPGARHRPYPPRPDNLDFSHWDTH